jgi:hypothetical protein
LFGGIARAARVTRVAASPRRDDMIALCVPEPVTFEEGGKTFRVSSLLRGKLCGDLP